MERADLATIDTIKNNDNLVSHAIVEEPELEQCCDDRHNSSGHGCVICLSDTIDSSTRAVCSPCLHASFDFSCLVTWLETNNECPLCKQQVHHVKYDFQSHGKSFKKYTIKATTQRNIKVTPRQRTSFRYPRQQRIELHGLSRPTDSILRRQYIYQHKLRSLHCGTNRRSRFIHFTPQTVRMDVELQSKAKAWIRRELEVFEWTSSNREWLLEYLLAVVKSMHLRSADGSAEKIVGELIGDEFAGVFIHDLYAFLRSPFVRIEDFDNWVQYDEEIPLYVDGKAIVKHRVQDRSTTTVSCSTDPSALHTERRQHTRLSNRWTPY